MLTTTDIRPKTETEDKDEEKEEGEGTRSWAKKRRSNEGEVCIPLDDSMVQTLSLFNALLPQLEQLQVEFGGSDSTNSTPDNTPLRLTPLLDLLGRSLSLQSLTVMVVD